MKKFYFLFFVLVIVIFFNYQKGKYPSIVSIRVPSSQKENEQKEEEQNYNRKLKIGDKEILVEIADTPQKSEKGLSGREKLDDGNGMLFVYPTPQFVTFWMPDMNFPLDIVFIVNNRIVEILDSVPIFPSDYPKESLPRYTSQEKVDWVLEVPSGWTKKNGIEFGDKIELM